MKDSLAVFRPWMDRWAGSLSGPVLEVGTGPPGKRVLPTREYRPDLDWVGLDLVDGKHVDLVHDIEEPIPGEYGGCVCLEVLEHIWRPGLALRNLHRAMKPGGALILTTLFSWEQHARPYDYWRFTDDCLRRLMEEAGFVDVVVEYNEGNRPYPPGPKAPRHVWGFGVA